MVKKATTASFVTGSKQTHAPKPKSLTPKVNTSKSGDKKREGKGARSVPY